MAWRPLKAAPTRIMTGTVVDSSDIASMVATFNMPKGGVINGQVNMQGNDWTLDIVPPIPGIYTFWINAEDTAGNSGWIGLFEVEIFIDLDTIFLPMVTVSGPAADAVRPVDAPDELQTLNSK